KTAEAILAERNSVTEGVATAPALMALASREGVSMPICQAVDDILSGRASLDSAIHTLLSRPFTQETI
ncbi:MAG: glycerol-3-phosphate dehydrogenase, partial [Henriciella sp.]